MTDAKLKKQIQSERKKLADLLEKRTEELVEKYLRTTLAKISRDLDAINKKLAALEQSR